MPVTSRVSRFRRPSLWVRMLVCCAVAGTSNLTFGAQKLRLLVESGDHSRINCPIAVALPDDVAKAAQGWELVEVTIDGIQPHPHQVLRRQQQMLTWMLTGQTPRKTLRTFEFRPRAAAPPEDKREDKEIVTAPSDGDVIHIRHRDRPVLTYHLAHVKPPAGADPKYGRSGHIHPVWTPARQIVTDEFPPDHLHQDGIFLAYTKTEFQGRQPNFWDLLGGTGFVRSGEVIEQYEGPVCGGFRVLLEHVDQPQPADRQVALLEEWDVRCWHLGDAPRAWRFEITSRIRCATKHPLVVKEYHYGGMALRGARNWVGDQVTFTTADGKTREAGNHARVPWVDLSGKAGEGLAGITVFSDPGNFRFPEPVRLHPTMPYFVFTPAVLGDWKIEPGTAHVSKYHYLVHDGEFHREEAERLWTEISDPPRVAVRVISE